MGNNLMGNNFRSNIFLSIGLLIVLFGQSEILSAEDSIKAPLSQQCQEKLYVQTDKKDYMSDGFTLQKNKNRN